MKPIPQCKKNLKICTLIILAPIVTSLNREVSPFFLSDNRFSLFFFPYRFSPTHFAIYVIFFCADSIAFSSSSDCSYSADLMIKTFRRSYRAVSSQTYPPYPLPQTRCGPNFDPIWMRFGPEIPFFRSKSGPNQVKNLEGPTCKPRHASVLTTHSDTQAVPAFHCIRMFKGFFSTRAFLKRTDTLSTNA